MSKNRAWNLASYETYSPQDTASTTAIVEVAVAICLNSLLSSTGRTPGGVLRHPCPTPPLWDDSFMSLLFRWRKVANPKNQHAVHLFQLFCRFLHPSLPLPNAHYSSEINITSRGCQHTHLLSTMGVIQCDSSPLKNPCYDPWKLTFSYYLLNN